MNGWDVCVLELCTRNPQGSVERITHAERSQCMKTHLAQNDCSRPADLVENKWSCRPHFVCGLWTSAIHRDVGSGMMIMVVVVVVLLIEAPLAIRWCG